MEIYGKDYYDQADLCLRDSYTLRIMENTVSEIFGDTYNGGAGPCLIAYFEIDGIIRYSSHNSFLQGEYDSSSLHSIDDIFYDKSGGLNFSLIANIIREMHRHSVISAYIYGQNPQTNHDIRLITNDRLEVDQILKINSILVNDNRLNIYDCVGFTTNTQFIKNEERITAEVY